jgi:spermidine/putrescine transport system permease protein
MATQTQERRLAFLATALPPIAWVVVFFLAPLAIVWAYSFGQNAGLTEVDISGTFANYARALEPLYLGIFVKSIFVAGLTTLLCLIVGFPVALAIVFASERWRPWMLLLVMLPFWTNLLIRTYALIAVLRTEGYVNFTLAWFWDRASWLMTLVGLAAARRLHAAAAALQQFCRRGGARLRPPAVHGAAALCRARPAR